MKENVAHKIDLDQLYHDHYRQPSVPDSLWPGVQARIASRPCDSPLVPFPTVRLLGLRFRTMMGAAAVLLAITGIWIVSRRDLSRNEMLAAIDHRFAQASCIAESGGNPFSRVTHATGSVDENPFQPLTPQQFREVSDVNPFGNR